jgi:hypothetical protein
MVTPIWNLRIRSAVGNYWYTIQDNFRNFLRSEECLEVGQLVAALP